MAEETRRSGRATKGQHTKDREISDAPAASKKKGTAKKATKKVIEEEEEPEEKIRCVCGEYEEETDIPRAMICCDNCEVWQHNDCMGLAEDYEPDSYFCEECKPENHKPLLAAMKKGQKPWEKAAQRRAEVLEAEKASKGKKGKKGGRKSGAADEVETPVATPTAGQKRKAEESPAPSETKANNKKAKGTPQSTPTADPPPTSSGRGRKAAASTPVATPPAAVLPKDPKDLPANRRGPAASLIKLFTDQTKIAVKDGFSLPSNTTLDAYGANLGMAIESAIYDHSTASASEAETYKTQLSSILLNIKRNNVLGGRVVRHEVTAEELATMPSAAMASEEQQRKDAEMQAQMDKQSTLVGQEETGPRIRRTHKGEEYVEDLSKTSDAPEASETKPQPQRQVSTSEVKSPTHAARRPPSVTIPNRRTSQDPRRQSSGNFDLNNVYSTVQGSPTGDQRFGEIAQPSREAPGPGARPDADIDNLLKDEDERMETPPYSPRLENDDSVWRGRINGTSVGTFNTRMKQAAGASIDAPTLRLTWEQLLPSEIGISGRIDPQKAEDYLCGLEFSQTSDLIVLWFGIPNHADDAAEFNRFFEYFKSRKRYGVGLQSHQPALKDMYFIPLEKDQPMPPFFLNLQTDFNAQAAERMILVPLVIKNTELPGRDTPAFSGATVMQTPITPREGWPGDGVANGGPQMTPYAYHSTPAPVNGIPANVGALPPQPQQAPPTFQQPPAAQHQSPPPGLPANATPSQRAALKILGPELSQVPAVQQLYQNAPNAGEQEMLVVKECLEDNVDARQSLDLLTRLLTEKWTAQRPPATNTDGNAAAGTAPPAAAATEAASSVPNNETPSGEH